MKRILLTLVSVLLLLSATGCAFVLSESNTENQDTIISGIEDDFENYLKSYQAQIGYVDQRTKDNLKELKALNYKAFAYCTSNFFVQTDAMNGDDSLTIRTFAQNGNVRREEYHEGSIAYVQVYNADTDIYYEFDVARNDLKKITNADQKGWSMAGYQYGFFEWTSCNAPQGNYSETELDGKKAILFDYDMGANGYNGVWYDAEYGIPLKYTQGKWVETYIVVPKTYFDASVFAFDSEAPTISLTLDDITVNASAQQASEQAADRPKSNKLSLETLEKIPSFSCVDSNGNVVTDAVFKDSQLTLVNLWGTWCSPCVAEMPTLQKLFDAYQEKGLNVIGIAEDANGNDDLIQEIIKTQGCAYTILYPSAEFYDDFVSLCFTFPTSLLVDNEGNILHVFTGNPGYEQFETVISSTLESIK